MSTSTFSCLLLAVSLPVQAALDDVRGLLQNKDAAKAAEVLKEMLAKRPDDPWLLYNSGVAAYVAGDFVKADEIWQQLAGMQLPDELRQQVWAQIGNASFRLAEPAIKEKPDTAVARLEQSREAYKVTLAQNRKNATASNNIIVVEKQLEKLYAQLAQRLVAEAKKENSAERAIEKLQSALDYQRNATALNPTDPEQSKAEKEIEQMIAQKLTERGNEAEKQADRTAAQPNLEQWRRDAAQQGFEKALGDFKQAQTFDPAKEDAKNGEQRVTEKLANLLAKAGREELKQGTQKEKQNAQEALERFEKALDNFDQALAVKADHQDAQAGREETRQAMERVHLQRGDQMAKTGEQQAKQNPAEAAENLLGALDDFEQAKALNPENPTIPPRIEKVQKLLPEVLIAMAKRDQQRAAKAEQNSPQQAVSHLERAEMGYDKAESLSPGNEQAQQGQKEVQDDLARLRKQLAQQPPQQPNQGKEKGEKDGPSFEAMLAQVKAREKDRDVNARNHAGSPYEQRGNGIKNW